MEECQRASKQDHLSFRNEAGDRVWEQALSPDDRPFRKSQFVLRPSYWL